MKIELKAIKQDPRDLNLAIATVDSLPESGNLLHAEQSIGDWCVRFMIIGESHRVRIEYRGQFVMEEMLACIQLESEQCQHYHSFQDLKAHDFTQSGYRVSVQMDRNQDLWQDGHQQIAYSFPEIDGREAVTKIQWQSDDEGIHWRTLHTYTEADALLCVYSDSYYSFHETRLDQ